MDRIAPLFVVGLAFAFIGWTMVVLTSRLERRRQQRHADRFGEHGPPLTQRPPWVRALAARRKAAQ